MSIMRAKEAFFHNGGLESDGTMRPDNDPLVVQFPSLYEPVEAAPASTTADDADELAVLREAARALDIAVDRRWGVARLRAEIASAQAAPHD